LFQFFNFFVIVIVNRIKFCPLTEWIHFRYHLLKSHCSYGLCNSRYNANGLHYQSSCPKPKILWRSPKYLLHMCRRASFCIVYTASHHTMSATNIQWKLILYLFSFSC